MIARLLSLAAAGAIAVLGTGCNQSTAEPGKDGAAKPAESSKSDKPVNADAKSDSAKGDKDKPKTEVATVAGGCFWCIEAAMERVEGVIDAESGYTGGHVKDPTYEQVCSKRTGHAEAVRISFDPSKISYADILDIFWVAHDPTTLNRQGADVGPQYRSAIFYHSDEQKKIAEASMKRLDESGLYGAKAVTEIAKAEEFYVAEIDHQDYYRLNPNAGYCRVVIEPKLEKLKKLGKIKAD
ncbi:MAG: peptide-methionine (S)-S-oxide reductase MsrA [Verrucomicrobiales bacterium]